MHIQNLIKMRKVFKFVAVCLMFVLFSCSKENAYDTSFNKVDNKALASTRSQGEGVVFSTEDIQTRLESIGAKYNTKVILVEGTDIKKINEDFFRFVETSLCSESIVDPSNMTRALATNTEDVDFMDDSSINVVMVRSTTSTESGTSSGSKEISLETDLRIKISWGATLSSVKAEILYDTAKYTLDSFTHTPLVGSYPNVSCSYTIKIKEKYGMGYLIKEYTGVL